MNLLSSRTEEIINLSGAASVVSGSSSQSGYAPRMFLFSSGVDFNPSRYYADAITALIEYGERLTARGTETVEIRPVSFAFNSEKPVTFLFGRKPNVVGALAEAIWVLAGRGDFKWISKFNSNLGNYLDNWGDGEFNAPYGHRIRRSGYHPKNRQEEGRDQLLDVVKRISKDNFTREAVITLWNPLYDSSENISKDFPCNDLIMFKYRNKVLDMTVINRSNDIHWGLFGVNIYQFSIIHRFVSMMLGMKLGTYFHYTDSLHYYVENEISKGMLGLAHGRNLHFLDLYSVYSAPEVYAKDMYLFQPKGDMDSFELFNREVSLLIYLFDNDKIPEAIQANNFEIGFFKECFHLFVSYLMAKDNVHEALKYSVQNCNMLDYLISYYGFLYRKSKRSNSFLCEIKAALLHKRPDLVSGYDNGVTSYIENG